MLPAEIGQLEKLLGIETSLGRSTTVGVMRSNQSQALLGIETPHRVLDRPQANAIADSRMEYQGYGGLKHRQHGP